ncbi:hypothetical protein ACH40D_15145 [Streptomyces olivaceoviridis]|uniref:Uncharacterized protein n=1 Tax=Streptomyces olivaceoviridis TaxID=1921 RepID=A0ABW7V6X2_STROI|nr:hypothetical protein [Streptomyces corchorusii]
MALHRLGTAAPRTPSAWAWRAPVAGDSSPNLRLRCARAGVVATSGSTSRRVGVRRLVATSPRAARMARRG